MADLKLTVDTSSVKSGTRDVQQFGQTTQNTAQAVTKFGGSATTASRGMNAIGVGIQQAGYQVGDFLVQVQSGTNWMVAFGQQATQLVGILPMFNSVMGISGTALVALSAGLGIAIPLVTAIGAAIMRTSSEAEDMSKSLERLEDSIRSYEDATQILNSSQEELEDRFGRFAAIAGRIGQELEARALREITAEVQNFANSLANVETMSGRMSALTATTLRDALGLSSIARDNDAIVSFANALISLENAQGIDAQVNAAQALLDTFDGIVGSQENLNSEQKQYRQTLVDLLAALAELGGIMDKDVNGRIREQLALEEERRAFVAEQLADLNNQTRLYQVIAQFGEDSVQAEAERARQAREAFQLEAMREGIYGDMLTPIMNQYDAMEEARMSAEKAAEEAERVTKALEAVSNLNDLPFTAKVEALAHMLGIAADEALRLMNNMPVGVTYGDRNALAGLTGGQLLFGGMEGDIPERRGRGGGGRSGTPDFVSRVFGPELQQAIEQAQEDLRLYNQEVKMLDSALQAGLVTQQEYNSFVAQAKEVYNQAQQGAYDYAQAMEQVEKTAMSSMENAFMSIIDGSKSAGDAFRDMARQILAEAMRMLVIRPLISSLFGGFGGGGGGLLGGLFGMRESGGSMMANRPYLVGERGPELVIPGRNATVMNADLTRKSMGGYDGVVVNQTINVNGGTDPAAIRMEVAKLMPQITNATKTAVIDARRRGGQMKAAFQ